MIKIPERVYLVSDVQERTWGDKIYTDIILRSRETYNGKEYDTFIPCQMAYKSTAKVPAQGSIIRCELDISSREKDGRYFVSFGIYSYKLENAPSLDAEPELSEPENEEPPFEPESTDDLSF